MQMQEDGWSVDTNGSGYAAAIVLRDGIKMRRLYAVGSQIARA